MKKDTKDLLWTIPLALATLAIPSFLDGREALPLILLAFTSALMLAIDFKPRMVVFFCIAALCGPLAESFAISMGAWTYAHPVIIGVPLWLFLVWGNAGILMSRIEKAVV